MLTDTVCAAASAAGLAVAFVTAYRKRFLAATRIAAYALLPVGLAMTGDTGRGQETLAVRRHKGDRESRRGRRGADGVGQHRVLLAIG
ncbi:hypothetical protein AB4212_33010 [Streptomyces sp. 2MCAF27]